MQSEERGTGLQNLFQGLEQVRKWVSQLASQMSVWGKAMQQTAAAGHLGAFTAPCFVPPGTWSGF